MSKETMLLLQWRGKLKIAIVRSDWARETPQDLVIIWANRVRNDTLCRVSLENHSEEKTNCNASCQHRSIIVLYVLVLTTSGLWLFPEVTKSD